MVHAVCTGDVTSIGRRVSLGNLSTWKDGPRTAVVWQGGQCMRQGSALAGEPCCRPVRATVRESFLWIRDSVVSIAQPSKSSKHNFGAVGQS
jgi:hypothetical protein